MDRLFIENGIKDLVVLAEDLHDNTKKMNVGARDMLMSAVSDMTKRSRAIRLITFGGDVSNLVNWLNASGSNSRVYTFKPDYDIRGSISQMDDNIVQKRKSAGGSFGGYFDFDWSKDVNASVLALDMSIISTQTMELLPGVTSRNSILVFKEGDAVGSALTGSISKQSFGLNLNFSFSANEGSAQAVRTLIELASIELFGKLTRVPYWSCLGIDPNHHLVKEEIGDWYYSLSQERKLIPYIQNQFRMRGVYSGPVDGSQNPEFQAVVPKARLALGLNEGNGIDEDLFSGLINLKTKNLGFPSEPVAHLTEVQYEEKKTTKAKKGKKSSAPVKSDEAKATKPLPQKVQISGKPVKPGADISLTVKSKENTFLYCYLNEPTHDSWLRIYPNRFAPDPWLDKNKSLQIPGDMKFEIKTGKKFEVEKVYCFNTIIDVTPNLPVSARGGDFEPLENYTLEKLRADFSTASAGAVAESSHQIMKQ
ncbi:MAG: DUF4384 domain-containing protein [Geobacteraceae bacterium]|nr:DUF4384 domain-containing protein [Geobacteraceae bacterium]